MNKVYGLVRCDNHHSDYLIEYPTKDVNNWHLPGGKIDSGESPEEALIRELKEETGLEATLECLTFLAADISDLTDSYYLYGIDVKGEVDIDTLDTGREVVSYGWRSRDDMVINSACFLPEVASLIKQWSKQEDVSQCLCLDNGGLIIG